MFTRASNVIEAVELADGTHKITYLVQSRPDRPADLVEYYKKVAEQFAYDYKAKLVGRVDVSLNPMRETAVIFFHIKLKKNPNKNNFKKFIKII